jgi:hypothetical protein
MLLLLQQQKQVQHSLYTTVHAIYHAPQRSTSPAHPESPIHSPSHHLIRNLTRLRTMCRAATAGVVALALWLLLLLLQQKDRSCMIHLQTRPTHIQ